MTQMQAAGHAATNEITNIKVAEVSKATVKAGISQAASTAERIAAANAVATQGVLNATTTVTAGGVTTEGDAPDVMTGGVMNAAANATLNAVESDATRDVRDSVLKAHNDPVTTTGGTTAATPGRTNAVTALRDVPVTWKSPPRLLGIC